MTAALKPNFPAKDMQLKSDTAHFRSNSKRHAVEV